MSKIKDHMIPYITRDEIEDMVTRLAREIEKDHKDMEIVLIGLLKGSIVFLADLMRKINLVQQVDFVRFISKASGSERIIIEKDISIDLKNKHVLIVEEIIDNGRTLSFLRNRILACQPSSLKIVTLLDKPARRQINIKPDYVGRTIEDRYVVGYGLDTNQKGRNYPDLYYPKH